MGTSSKSRILVSLTSQSRDQLRQLARQRREPLATVASRMLDAGLELEEDVALAARAHARAKRKGVRYVAHSDVWATLLK